MQNALYGKFAMQRERIMYADISERDKLEAEGHTVSEIIYDMNGIRMEFLEYDGYAMAEYIQPHISAYITSIARILLFKGLKYAHEKEFWLIVIRTVVQQLRNFLIKWFTIKSMESGS